MARSAGGSNGKRQLLAHLHRVFLRTSIYDGTRAMVSQQTTVRKVHGSCMDASGATATVPSGHVQICTN